jgi:hypothetical protein
MFNRLVLIFLTAMLLAAPADAGSRSSHPSMRPTRELISRPSKSTDMKLIVSKPVKTRDEHKLERLRKHCKELAKEGKSATLPQKCLIFE